MYLTRMSGERVGIYGRQSKDKQKSIAEQLAEQRADAAEQGWTVVREYDDGESASRFGRGIRTGWVQLLADLKAQRFDVVSLWESSRGDRTLSSWATFLELCRTRGVRVRVVNHGSTYDLTNARHWKTLAEDGVNNHYASEETSLRIQRDKRASAAAGRPAGRLLWGYGRRYDERGTYVETFIRDDQAGIIREMFARFAEGEAAYSIARDLNARGVGTPTGARWVLEQVRRVLSNPAYIARRVHRGQVVGDAAWPAIVDLETWNRCAARLADPRRKTVRDASLKHLLTGVARCDVCGSPMGWLSNRGTPSYACDGTASPSARFCTSIKEADLDGYITAVVVARLQRPDVLALVAGSGSDAPEATDVRARITLLRRELDDALELVQARKLSVKSFAGIEQGLSAQIEQLEEQARPASVSPLLANLAGPDVVARWEALTLGQRREVVAALLSVRVARASVPGRRTFEPARVLVQWRS